MLKITKLYDYVLPEWNALQVDLCYIYENVLPTITSRETDSIYHLKRTLDKWCTILTSFPITERDIIFVAKNLDDLKTKLENRVVSWYSNLGTNVSILLTEIDELDIAIEYGMELISVQKRLVDFLVRNKSFTLGFCCRSLFMSPYRILRKDWDKARAAIGDY